MQLRSSDASEWLELGGDPDDEPRRRLDARLRQVLGAERLVVVAGLGTSLCIVDGDGQQLAPSMSDLWSACKERVGTDAWANALEAAGWENTFDDDIEAVLSRCQMALTLSPDDEISKFVLECEHEIAKACRFVREDVLTPVHEAFLRGVARRPARLPRTQLFTTNYDLAFETAAARIGFAVVDGFSYSSPQRFDSAYFEVDFAVRDRERAATPVEWMPNVIQLLKLHGSVDWEARSDGVTRVIGCERPLIIYPRASKFEISYQPPFLELMARFQASLRRPDTGVIVVGSGLRDRHVVEPLMAGVRGNVRLSLVVVSPGLANSDNEHVLQLQNLVDQGDRRVTLVAGTFQELVPKLPELVPATEAEQHAERLNP